MVKTGDIKANTITLVNNFVKGILVKSIENKNLNIYEEYKVQVISDFSINLDKVIIDQQNKPVVHIEHKSYGDIDMLKRFITDSHALLKYNNSIINVAICLQPATPLKAFTGACSLFDVKFNENIYLLTLTEKNREYKKDKDYLLTYNKEFIINRT